MSQLDFDSRTRLTRPYEQTIYVRIIDSWFTSVWLFLLIFVFFFVFHFTSTTFFYVQFPPKSKLYALLRLIYWSKWNIVHTVTYLYPASSWISVISILWEIISILSPFLLLLLQANLIRKHDRILEYLTSYVCGTYMWYSPLLTQLWLKSCGCGFSAFHWRSFHFFSLLD